jgi:hypothetical protein
VEHGGTGGGDWAVHF